MVACDVLKLEHWNLIEWCRDARIWQVHTVTEICLHFAWGKIKEKWRVHWINCIRPKLVILSCLILLSTVSLSEITWNGMHVMYSNVPLDEELWGNEFPLPGWWWASYGFCAVLHMLPLGCVNLSCGWIHHVRMRFFYKKVGALGPEWNDAEC